MLYKHFTGQVKEVTEGKGSAIFATLNVVDKDGDLTVPGAFGQQKAKVSPAHDWSAPGMGVANIRESGNEAIADFQLYMDMLSAKEWSESLKKNAENGLTQEWSYGFDVLEESYEDRDGRKVRVLKRLKVYEVSPVMVGAGIDTRTLQMKSGLTLEQQLESTLYQSQQFLTRCKALTALRVEKGRTNPLSETNAERLKSLASQLTDVQGELKTLLESGHDDQDGIERLLLDYAHTESQIRTWEGSHVGVGSEA